MALNARARGKTHRTPVADCQSVVSVQKARGREHAPDRPVHPERWQGFCTLAKAINLRHVRVERHRVDAAFQIEAERARSWMGLCTWRESTYERLGQQHRITARTSRGAPLGRPLLLSAWSCLTGRRIPRHPGAADNAPPSSHLGCPFMHRACLQIVVAMHARAVSMRIARGAEHTRATSDPPEDTKGMEGDL